MNRRGRTETSLLLSARREQPYWKVVAGRSLWSEFQLLGGHCDAESGVALEQGAEAPNLRRPGAITRRRALGPAFSALESSATQKLRSRPFRRSSARGGGGARRPSASLRISRSQGFSANRWPPACRPTRRPTARGYVTIGTTQDLSWLLTSSARTAQEASHQSTTISTRGTGRNRTDE